MIADPIAVLSAIVAEVAGAGQPFSADSFLPPHLIHDAREAIESGSSHDEEKKLLGRQIISANKTTVEKQHEIDLCREEMDRHRKRIHDLQKINACLATPYTRPAADDESHAGCEARAQLLLVCLRKADETIVALRAEIDQHQSKDEAMRRAIATLTETNAELDRKLESAMSKRIPGCPPESLPNTGHLVLDPFQILTAYGRRQECDE